MLQYITTETVTLFGSIVTLAGMYWKFRADLRRIEADRKAAEASLLERAERDKADQSTSLAALVEARIKTHMDRLDEENKTLRARIKELEKDHSELYIELQITKASLDHDPLPFWTKRADDFRIVYVSHSWEQLTGIPAVEAIGKTNQELYEAGLIPKEVADDWDRGDEEARKAGGREIITEERSVTPEGSTFGWAIKWRMRVITIGNEQFINGRYIDKRVFA